MKAHEFVADVKKNEFSLIITCEKEKQNLLRRNCLIIQTMHKIPDVDQWGEIEILLKLLHKV